MDSWGPNGGPASPSSEPTRNPRLTVRYEVLDTPLEPVEVTFNLSPSYGIRTVDDAHGWFLRMMREREEFEVQTDQPGEPPLSFRSEAVRHVLAE